MDKIFGHDWTDIQRAQQGGALHKRITAFAPLAAATDADLELLRKHGSIEALRAIGFDGVVDRLSRTQRL